MSAYTLDDYAYTLPEDRIAQVPITPRDHSRLLQLKRHTGKCFHHRFENLIELLHPGDVLVLNDTRVVPVRLLATKPTGGKIEFLILNFSPGALPESTPSIQRYRCLIKGAPRQLPSDMISIAPNLQARILSCLDNTYEVEFVCGAPLGDILEDIGQMPLPPYIRRQQQNQSAGDRQHYQTVYASEQGAIAAPTAGLHFTHTLLERLGAKGVQMVTITLHVGVGTFMPVRSTDIRQHAMHAENYIISPDAADRLSQAKARGQRIVAVGTTCVRTLEDAIQADGTVKAGAATCNLFIYPGFEFKCVDALITNFHLPRSTLIMLVAAFAGRERILAAYHKAIRCNYRFFSYGDAMLID